MTAELPNFRGPEIQSLKPFLDWLPGENLSVLEIGTFAGDGAIQFLAHEKVARLTCVDLFQPGYDPDDTASDADMGAAKLKWMAQVHQTPKPVSLFMHQRSSDIRRGAEIFDVVYIDASHLEPDVIFDIHESLHMASRVVAGHDYGVGKHPGVQRAVDYFFAPQLIRLFPDSSWAVCL